MHKFILLSKLHIFIINCIVQINCTFSKANCINQHHMHSKIAYAIFKTNMQRKPPKACGKKSKHKAPILCNRDDKEICAVLKPYMQAMYFPILIIFQLSLFQNKVHTSHFNVKLYWGERREKECGFYRFWP